MIEADAAPNQLCCRTAELGWGSSVRRWFGDWWNMASWTGKTRRARVEACRERAAQNTRATLASTDPDIKASYQDLAIQWRELAAQLEDPDNCAA
jgi:hypothetical protein